ncbi:MAG: hypothetical protein JWQ81_8540 [Amycolatopsis sp.]|uniref:DUF2637 domain-containing protein n=1 Tax=Amycolatopsis sp. TaxID=37632 RepID=UPI002603E861|nr:DUF2637 domain-containing protein [Amycolatopsis sp.]MCU1687801.1 hypothetical protein [Amycolatopsis sp.]
MPSTARQSTIRRELGGAASIGLAIIAFAGIIFSFVGLRQLAIDTGIGAGYAWLLPITIDAATLVAARIWLLPTIPEDVRAWARQWMLAAIGLSIGGNVVERAIHAGLLVLPWWAVVVVGAVPPAMLASVVHLASLVISGRYDNADHQAPAWRPVTTNHQVTSHQPATHLPPVIAEAAPTSDLDDLIEHARALRAADPAIGRSRIAAELRISDHTARRVIAQLGNAA